MTTNRVNRILAKIIATTVIAGSTACSTKESVSAIASSITVTDDSANTDVQVLSASAGQSLSADNALTDCKIYDKQPTGPGKFEAKTDCSAAAEAQVGLPLLNKFTEALLWIYEPSVGTPYAVSRHWCARTDVTVIVKEAAWNSRSFREIGFYSREDGMEEAAEATVTFAKNDARLRRDGEVTLANGEKALKFNFVAAGPCAVSGTGDNPGHEFKFKPFVMYDGGLRRWEAVSGDHGIGYGQKWERAALLQH